MSVADAHSCHTVSNSVSSAAPAYENPNGRETRYAIGRRFFSHCRVEIIAFVFTKTSVRSLHLRGGVFCSTDSRVIHVMKIDLSYTGVSFKSIIVVKNFKKMFTRCYCFGVEHGGTVISIKQIESILRVPRNE